MPRRKTITKSATTKRVAKKKTSAKKKAASKVIASKKIEAPVEMTFEEESKIEREKIIAMWAAVGFFIIIIFSFWIISFKSSIKHSIKETPASGAKFNQLISDFNIALEETKNNFNDFQDVLEEDSVIAEESEVKEDQIQKLEQRISEMEKQIELEKFLDKLNSELDTESQTGE